MISCVLPIETEGFEKCKKEIEAALFPLEIEIVSELFSVGLEGYQASSPGIWDSNVHWTKAVKECLYNIGKQKGFLVFPRKQDGAFRGEWMFDLVWVDAEPDESDDKFNWRNARGLKLVCECEWDKREDWILDDFFKLTFAIAELRLFIYSNKTSGNTHPALICKRACPLSRGQRFLLVGFPEKTEEGIRVDAWTA